MKRAVIVGGGLGGLSAAIALARGGVGVTLFEKNERVGGKMDVWSAGGYRFDTGPTLLTMPDVLASIFAAAGRRLEDHLEVVPLDPACRYIYPDGSHLDAHADTAQMDRSISAFSPSDAGAFPRFMSYAEGIYRHAAGPFLFTPFGSLRPAEVAKHLRFLPSVFKIDAFRTVHEANRAHFQDRRLVQLFDRFATYNGSSPYRAPATLSIIPYVEFHFGGWYVRGGMRKVADALGETARALGVEIRTGVTVAEIVTSGGSAVGIETEAGERIAADAVLCNADALYAHRELLRREAGKTAGAFTGVEPSLAGYVMLLGVRRKYHRLAHHTIIFSSDYEREFRSLFDLRRPYDDPTVYVSVSAMADPDHAPPGCSNMFVLVNAPPLGPEFDWSGEGQEYRAAVLAKLESAGLEGIAEAIEVERIVAPNEFAAAYNAYRGSIYGTSSNNRYAAFLRPPNRSRRVRRLYFAGGSAHPGGGIPLVLLSGNIAAGLMLGDLR